MCVRLHVSHHKLWKREKKSVDLKTVLPFLFFCYISSLLLHTHTHIQTTGKRRRKFGFNWSGSTCRRSRTGERSAHFLFKCVTIIRNTAGQYELVSLIFFFFLFLNNIRRETLRPDDPFMGVGQIPTIAQKHIRCFFIKRPRDFPGQRKTFIPFFSFHSNAVMSNVRWTSSGLSFLLRK